MMRKKLTELRRRWQERWDNLYQVQRDLVLFGVGALGLAVLAFAGYRLLAGPLRVWRGHQALAQAERAMRQEDYRTALLALKRATLLTPNDPATWRVVARQLDVLDVPESLVAHENLVHLSPGDTAQQFALVRRALHFQDAGLAARALAAVPDAATDGAEYHRLAAALALSMGRPQDYLQHLRALLALEPDDARARFDLAVSELWSGGAAAPARAREEFTALLQDPAMRVRAALELLKDAARRRDAGAAEQAAGAIDVAFPSPAALAGLPPGWDRLRAKLKAAATAPEDAALLAGWLGTLGSQREALAWLDGLPEQTRRDPAVGDAAIALSAQLNDAARLKSWLAGGAWGELTEGDRRALVRVASARADGQTAAERPAWLEAQAAVGDSVAGLRALARLAAIWGNDEATIRALEALVRRSPRDAWGRQSLQALYAGRGESEKLLEFYAGWRKADPDNLQAAASWWRLAAVLDRLPEGADAEVAALISTAAESPPVRAAAAAVYWRLKENSQAAVVLAEIPEEDRARPEVAFWSGVIDAESGRPEAGRELRLAAESAWLPEETAILHAAQRRAAP